MRVLHTLVVALVVLSLAEIAQADWEEEFYNGPDVQDDGSYSNCGAIDPSQPCYASTAKMYYCAAEGSLGGYCVTVKAINGVRQCANVLYSASCKCDEDSLKTEGSCNWRW